MKKMFKIAGLIVLMAAIFMASSAFTKPNDNQSEKSCKVTVKYKNGDLAKSLQVTAWYSGFSGGYHDFKTDDNGNVRLTGDIHEIEYLYIKGDKYEVSYKDGKEYSLVLRKNRYD